MPSDEFRGGTPADNWPAAYSHSRPAYTQHGEAAFEGVRAGSETKKYFLNNTTKVEPANLFDNAARAVKA